MTTTPLRFGVTFMLSFALLVGAFEASRGSAFIALYFLRWSASSPTPAADRDPHAA